MSPLHTLPISPGNDLTFEVYIPPAKDPSTGELVAYPGLTITGWLAEGATPETRLNGTEKTFTRIAPGRFLWFFQASEVDACFAGITPTPADGASLLAGIKGAGEFQAFRRLAYAGQRVVP